MRGDHSHRRTTRREILARGGALFAGVIVWAATISSHSAAQGKMPKEQAKYQDTPQGDKTCDKCRHFIADENACKVVEGDINPQGWCQLWTAAS